MVKKIAPAVKMKIETIAQRQLHFQHANFYVLTARVLRKRESVIISRTVITAWTKPIVLVLTQHNGVARGVINVFLSVTSAMEQWNVLTEKMKKTAQQYYQQQLPQPYQAFRPNQSQILLHRLPQLQHFALKETKRTRLEP